MSLIKIDETDISSNVSRVTVDNVFSSTYDIYKIIFTGITNETAFDNGSFYFRLVDNSGTVIGDSDGSSEYDRAILYARGASNTFLELKNTSNSVLAAIYNDTAANKAAINGVIYVFQPYASKYTYIQGQNSGRAKYSSPIPVMQRHVGSHDVEEVIRGFDIIPRSQSGNLTGGKVVTYGLKA